MRNRKIIGLFVFIAAAVAAIYFFKEYNRTNKQLNEVTSDLAISAAALLQAYQQNDSLANKKFLGKVITVSGRIKAVESSSLNVSLDDTNSNALVRCSMDSSFSEQLGSLQHGDTIKIKGVCTGFNKDDTGLLGDEVILNRCVLEK